jgi:hypothetical protein
MTQACSLPARSASTAAALSCLEAELSPRQAESICKIFMMSAIKNECGQLIPATIIAKEAIMQISFAKLE